jgi:hypothetical protein
LYAGSSLVSLALRLWRPALWVVLLAGALIGSVPARYFIFGIAQGFGDYMTSGRSPRTAPPFELSPEFLLYYLQGWAGVFVAWLAVGLIFERLYCLPRFSSIRSNEPQATTAVAAAESVVTSDAMSRQSPESVVTESVTRAGSTPPLLERLPERLGQHVIALQAEDHCVRVHTDRGSTLVLARLSDAIAELGAVPGMRVHRSYWVRKGAVKRVAVNGKGWLLKLSNGLDVPVSQSYKALVRKDGVAPR